MIKKIICFIFILLCVCNIDIKLGYTQEITKDEMVNELHELKEKMKKFENALENPDNKNPDDEKKTCRGFKKYLDSVELSGTVEVEAVYERLKPAEAEEKIEKSSDLTLSTVELGIDAEITEQVKTHILFSYEQGEDVIIDEALVHFQAEDICKPDLSCNSPWYGSIGKMNIPFGFYETHFFSSPLTQELGEADETALLLGVHKSVFNIAAGIFNGDMDKTGTSDHIENYFGTCRIDIPEHIIPELKVIGGASYISNISDSDELTDFIKQEFESETIEDKTAGINVFISISYAEKYFMEAEYVSALDSFKENENFKPKAWNFEFAFKPLDDFELTLAYGISRDTLDFLPETRWGIAGVYEILKNTSLGIEYLYDEYENNDEAVSITSQLAVEF